MPNLTDAINAIMTLKEISDSEQQFIVEFTEEGRYVTNDELHSHLNLIKNLLGSQTALLQIMMTLMFDADDQLKKILEKLGK